MALRQDKFPAKGELKPSFNDKGISGQLTDFSEKHIHAPYNFVPLAPKIVQTDSGDLGHDLPHSQGISGEISFEIEAVTPLFIGDAKSTSNSQPREFFQIAGTPTIPGSSFKGMFRNVLSIAARSQLKPQTKALSMRDLKYQPYLDKMHSKKSGWLSYDADENRFVIENCRYLPVDHKDIVKCYPNFRSALTDAGATARSKSEAFADLNRGKLTTRFVETTRILRINGKDTKVQYAVPGDGQNLGLMVFTGQPRQNRDLNTEGVKHTEFIFTDLEQGKNPQKWIVPLQIFQKVQAIHAETSVRKDKSWDTFLKKKLQAGKRIPVFFLEDNGRVSSFGIASMFRLLADASPSDFVPEAHKSSELRDFAKALFGYSEKAENQENQLTKKGRVFFSAAPCKSRYEFLPDASLVLSSPRPTFYPAYLEQRAAAHNPNVLDPSAEYNTYLTKDSKISIRGWKRYPVRTKTAQPAGKISNTQVTQIRPIRQGAKFSGRVVFHNLTPIELGALLWSFDFGGITEACHTLGGGKPYGYGVVRLKRLPQASRLYPAADPVGSLQPRDYVKEFEEYVQQQLGSPFYGTPEMVELLDMATLPVGSDEKVRSIEEFLTYMQPVGKFAESKGSPKKGRHERQVLVRYSEARKRLGQSTYRDNPYKPGDRPKL